jgi:CubicO group peptidase (beta-lactamase class C family)
MNKDGISNIEKTNKRFETVDSFIMKNKKRVRSLIIVEKGIITHESYFHEENPDTLHELRSITKSIISSLIGIAIDKKLLKGLDQTLRDIFKNETMSDDIGNITIKQLLTMTSGIQITDNELLALAKKKDALETIFFAKVNKPTSFSYKSIDPHLLSMVLSYVTGKSAKLFGQEVLFSILDIKNIHWLSDAFGNSIGSTGLLLTPRDLVKIGMLYLFRGNWQGNQVIPNDWINDTFSSHSEGLSKYGEYGYLWWINKEKKYYNAAGSGGQYLYVYPKTEIVVAITADTTRPFDETSEIFESFILPSLT